MVPYYSVKLKNGLIDLVTKEFLSDVEEERLSYIPITCEQLQAQAHLLDPEILQSLLKATTPSSLLKEFLNLHERLGHMPFVIMFRLCSINRLPAKFLILQNESVLCPSCIFAQATRRKWRHGKRQAGKIRREHHTSPGDGTMCDQMMSAQPGLVPRMYGRHTKDMITAVSVFLDSVTGHSFSHLQTSTGGMKPLLQKDLMNSWQIHMG